MAPHNRYVTLGRSGLRVSPLCLGAMTFGDEWAMGADVETSQRVMDRYLEWGGNFIDTANIYTKGHSEKIIGDHLGKFPSKRDRLVIATKFLGGMYLGDPNGGGAHRKSLMAACEQSLRRLQTDYIDLYWMHFFDRHTPIEETMRAMDDLVRSGKVRYLGFSDTPAWVCAQAQTIAQFRGWSPLIALQIEYSLIERSVENDLTPMALAMGLGVTPWSPLKGGILSGKYRRGGMPTDSSRSEWNAKKLNDRAYAIIDELVAVAKETESTPARVALGWLLARPAVGSVIIGARTPAQLDDNLMAVELSLAPAHLARLDTVSKQDPIFPHGFLSFVTDNVQGGTTVNGIPSQSWALAPQSDAERW